MSMFRVPLYLDLDTLVPLAKYHDIEVMFDVAVEERDLGQRKRSAGISASVVPISAGISKETEHEMTQSRTVTDDPTSALNRLLDTLTRNGDLVDDPSADGGIAKRQVVEFDGEWEISRATDAGALLTKVLSLVAGNPQLLDGQNQPSSPEFLSLLTAQSPSGPVVLDGILSSADNFRVLVLLNSLHLTASSTIDDLVGDRSVFGVVDALVPAGVEYSLERHLLAGLNRSLRRQMNAEEVLSGFPGFSPADMKVEGPIVVVKAVSVY